MKLTSVRIPGRYVTCSSASMSSDIPLHELGVHLKGRLLSPEEVEDEKLEDARHAELRHGPDANFERLPLSSG